MYSIYTLKCFIKVLIFPINYYITRIQKNLSELKHPPALHQHCDPQCLSILDQNECVGKTSSLTSKNAQGLLDFCFLVNEQLVNMDWLNSYTIHKKSAEMSSEGKGKILYNSLVFSLQYVCTYLTKLFMY